MLLCARGESGYLTRGVLDIESSICVIPAFVMIGSQLSKIMLDFFSHEMWQPIVAALLTSNYTSNTSLDGTNDGGSLRSRRLKQAHLDKVFQTALVG